MMKYYELTDNWGFNWNYKHLENACKHITDYVNTNAKMRSQHATYGYSYNAETEAYIYNVCWTDGTIERFIIEAVNIETMD